MLKTEQGLPQHCCHTILLVFAVLCVIDIFSSYD